MHCHEFPVVVTILQLNQQRYARAICYWCVGPVSLNESFRIVLGVKNQYTLSDTSLQIHASTNFFSREELSFLFSCYSTFKSCSLSAKCQIIIFQMKGKQNFFSRNLKNHLYDICFISCMLTLFHFPAVYIFLSLITAYLSFSYKTSQIYSFLHSLNLFPVSEF